MPDRDFQKGSSRIERGQEILDLLHRLNEREQLTILMVTHDPLIAEQAHRTVRLCEGRIQQLKDAA